MFVKDHLSFSGAVGAAGLGAVVPWSSAAAGFPQTPTCSATYFCPAVYRVVSQPAVTVSDQVVHAAHEEADLLAAGLPPLYPRDFVPADVFRGVALLADQLSVCEPARFMQGFDILQDAQPSLCP